MAARSIASLTITFGLVSIPVKPYSAYDKAYFLAPDKGGPKPAKRPVSPRTGRACDYTNPATWSSFEDAFGYYRERGLSGVDLGS